MTRCSVCQHGPVQLSLTIRIDDKGRRLELHFCRRDEEAFRSLLADGAWEWMRVGFTGAGRLDR